MDLRAMELLCRPNGSRIAQMKGYGIMNKGILIGLGLAVISASAGVAQTAVTTSGGTTGTVPVFTGSATLGSSAITQSGSNVGVGVASPATVLDVNGTIHTSNGSNGLMIGPLPTPSLATEYAVRSLPSIVVNGDVGGQTPDFTGNSIAVFDFRANPGNYTTSFPPPSIYIGKSRSGTNGTPGGIVQSGDILGALSFVGDNGSNFGTQGAYIGGEVDGTPTSTSVPGRLTFATTAIGSANPVERMRITSTGAVGIGTTTTGAYMLDVNGQIGASGQIISSNGFCIAGSCITAWPTASAGGAGTVTSITAGSGLSGGTITTTGTIGLNLGNSNSWTAPQAFGGGATFPGSGVWTSSGNVGIGTATPTATLQIGSPSATGGAQGAFSPVLKTFHPTVLGSTAATDLALASIGFTTGNNVALGIHAYRASVGSDWTTSAIRIGMDVDNSTRIGANIWLNANGNIGIGTTAAPSGKLEVNGNVVLSSNSGGSIIFQDGSVQNVAYTGVTCGGDYAESVDVTGNRTSYEPGDVLVLDENNPGKILKSIEAYSTSVSGIYSTKPGTVGRRQTTPKSPDEVPMAVVGIVPAKVSVENGPIKVGDLLVTSSTPGYAMKGTDRSRMLGAVVGKAMAKLDSGTGVIEVLVTLQ